MGDFDDMNATPLGKLPPMPAMQTKGDGPSVDMNVSYNDILKTMRSPAQAPQAQQQMGPGPSPHQPMQQQQPPMLQQQVQPQQQMQQMQMQQMQQMQMQQQQQREVDMYEPYYAPVPRGRATQPRSLKRRGVLDTLREYKTSILVVVVVFAVLWYLAPKLAQAAPQLLTESGKFNPAGLLVIAAATGGIHRVADHYLG